MQINNDSKPTSIAEFLSRNDATFKIPEFQRPYAWDTDNVNTFIEDLEYTVSKKTKHYFGSVVYSDSDTENEFTIIDGQQRVTTVILLITALFHILKDNNIKTKYLTANNTNKIKLRTVTTDNSILDAILNNKLDELGATHRKHKLWNTYALFRDHLKTKANVIDYLDGLFRFEIVDVHLEQNDDSPNKVFESINSTGRPLSAGDKIRNFSLMLDNEAARNKVYRDYWTRIEYLLSNQKDDLITKFFRFYLIFNNNNFENINDTVIYRNYKQFAIERGYLSGKELEYYDNYYKDVIDKLFIFKFVTLGDDIGKKFVDIVDTNNKFLLIPTEPPKWYLAHVIDFLKNDWEAIKQVYGIVESYIIRRVLADLPQKSYNTFFAKLHNNIIKLLPPNSNSKKYIDYLANYLAAIKNEQRCPDVQEIKTRMLTTDMYKNGKYGKYILSMLESYSLTTQKSMFSFIELYKFPDKNLQIEHIMPQALDFKSWEIDKSLHAQYVNTLPNLSLTMHNAALSNLDFLSKRTSAVFGYDSDKFSLNKYFLDNNINSWNEKSIKMRSEWLASSIDKIWKPLEQNGIMVDPELDVIEHLPSDYIIIKVRNYHDDMTIGQILSDIQFDLQINNIDRNTIKNCSVVIAETVIDLTARIVGVFDIDSWEENPSGSWSFSGHPAGKINEAKYLNKILPSRKQGEKQDARQIDNRINQQ
jgi:uncharacterized protein with ParB-like and HNH nuclease domain